MNFNLWRDHVKNRIGGNRSEKKFFRRFRFNKRAD